MSIKLRLDRLCCAQRCPHSCLCAVVPTSSQSAVSIRARRAVQAVLPGPVAGRSGPLVLSSTNAWKCKWDNSLSLCLSHSFSLPLPLYCASDCLASAITQLAASSAALVEAGGGCARAPHPHPAPTSSQSSNRLLTSAPVRFVYPASIPSFHLAGSRVPSGPIQYSAGIP